MTWHTTSAPVQVGGEVLTNERAGEYHLLTVTAPGVPDRSRPGQFVAVAVGGERSPMLGRRAFSIYEAVGAGGSGDAQRSRRGSDPDAVSIVFAVHGGGTAWLAGLRPGDALDLVGPLGRPFLPPPGSEPARPTTLPFPAEDLRLLGVEDPPRGVSGPRPPGEEVTGESSGRCVLVGGGYGSAPLFSLAELLLERGHRVDVVLGAASAERLFGVGRARRTATSAVFTTVDGSLGRRGVVTDVLPGLLGHGDAAAVYACGPMPMLRAVTATAAEYGVPTQVAVEESMACGIGVCMTCVLPVVGRDGVTRMTRSCVDGPVFPGNAVRWNDIGTVPSDAVGANA